MKNKRGQSLIDVVFSIGILSLVLVGVMMLVVGTAKAKIMASERQKAIQLSQLLIETKVVEVKNDMLTFWNSGHENKINQSEIGFDGYLYDVRYESCDTYSCKIIFTVKWGDNQSLSVERLFSRQGL